MRIVKIRDNGNSGRAFYHVLLNALLQVMDRWYIYARVIIASFSSKPHGVKMQYHKAISLGNSLARCVYIWMSNSASS